MFFRVPVSVASGLSPRRRGMRRPATRARFIDRCLSVFAWFVFRFFFMCITFFHPPRLRHLCRSRAGLTSTLPRKSASLLKATTSAQFGQEDGTRKASHRHSRVKSTAWKSHATGTAHSRFLEITRSRQMLVMVDESQPTRLSRFRKCWVRSWRKSAMCHLLSATRIIMATIAAPPR